MENDNREVEKDEEEPKEKHVCDMCGQRFSQPSRLLIHTRKHTGERPYKCEKCGSSYMRAQHLDRHMKTHNEQYIDSIKVRCSRCNEMFANETCLKKHFIKFHDLQLTTRKKFECPEEGCNEVFMRKKHLAQHGLTHSKSLTAAVKIHACPHDGCGMRFNYPARLKAHLKIHEGYRCNHDGCDALLPDYNSLRSHKAIAHPSFLCCSQCGKSFARRSHLADHMMTHQSTRPTYACTWEGCTRSFFHEKNLKLHIRQNHEGENIWGLYRERRHKPPLEEKKKKKKARPRKTLLEKLCGIVQNQSDGSAVRVDLRDTSEFTAAVSVGVDSVISGQDVDTYSITLS